MSHGHAPPFPKEDILTKPDAILKESYMLVDATLKEPFPPVSLPRREFMEKAAAIWKELELPELKPEYPWFGFSLGDWTEENQHEAQLALEGQTLRSRREAGKTARAALSECGRAMAKSFKDIREHLAALEQAGKLIKIARAINKDTELMPLVRWQFRGLPESRAKSIFVYQRRRRDRTQIRHACRGRLFGGVTRDLCSWSQLFDRSDPAEMDGGGEKSDRAENRRKRAGPRSRSYWTRTCSVIKVWESFRCRFPLPGFDNGPYTTSSHWFTKDPDTKILNIGNYRGQIKSPLRMGIALSSRNHGGIHWGKCRAKGIPLEAALVVGAPPAVAYTAPARVPYGKSELAVAGGLAGAPIDVVRCKTVDIVVPAWAEIVIEGEISTEALEPEAPFGEATGYVATRLMHPFFNVKCITHRKDPVLMNIVSQFPPSESSIMRQMSAEAIYTRFLRENCNVPGVVDVTFHSLAVRQVCVVQAVQVRPRRSLAGDVPCPRPQSLHRKNCCCGRRGCESARLGHADLDDCLAGTTAQRHAGCEKPHPLHGSVGRSGRTGSAANAQMKPPIVPRY